MFAALPFAIAIGVLAGAPALAQSAKPASSASAMSQDGMQHEDAMKGSMHKHDTMMKKDAMHGGAMKHTAMHHDAMMKKNAMQGDTMKMKHGDPAPASSSG
jgi:pentapeptide MXKDX repeat protein